MIGAEKEKPRIVAGAKDQEETNIRGSNKSGESRGPKRIVEGAGKGDQE